MQSNNYIFKKGTEVIHMVSLVKNEDVEKCLRELLKSEGYELDKSKTHGENGVDILAKKEGETIYIEVIGHKSAGPARARDFYESFFRAISRLNEDATDCVIAMPKQAEIGLPQRAKQYNVSWERIGKAFPELKIWLIDVENKTYKRTDWGEWLKNK
jgi:hypothetical protein